MTTTQSDVELVRAELARSTTGEVLAPGDAGYEETVAVWNARFTSHPDVAVRCTATSDVQACVMAARQHGLPLTVKSGGHDYAGHSAADGGVLVDLSRMREVSVDADDRRVTAGPGARWRDLDAETQTAGLATPGATVSSVGVAGCVLGGGQGWLTRAHGLAVDNLLAAQMVTADGRLVRAAADENSDLFWGLRGGSGNLGIVTSLELALHPVGPQVTAGQVMYPLDRAREGLRLYRDLLRRDDTDSMGFAFFLRIPPLPDFPEWMHGQVVLDFVLFHPDPGERGEAALAPFRRLGGALLDTVGPTTYVELQQGFDAGMAPGSRWYSRSHHFATLSDEAIDTLVTGVADLPGAFSIVYLTPETGAPQRVASDAAAYPHRSSEQSLHILPGWSQAADDEQVMAWACRLYADTSAHGSRGVYVNLLGEDEDGRIGDAYEQNLERLRGLKATWDPNNLFRRNHNVAAGART